MIRLSENGIPQILGAASVGISSNGVTNILADSYTWVDIIMAAGGFMGGMGALIGSLVTLYNALIKRRLRKRKEALKETD